MVVYTKPQQWKKDLEIEIARMWGNEDANCASCHRSTRSNQERHRQANLQNSWKHQRHRTAKDRSARIRPYPSKIFIY